MVILFIENLRWGCELGIIKKEKMSCMACTFSNKILFVHLYVPFTSASGFKSNVTLHYLLRKINAKIWETVTIFHIHMMNKQDLSRKFKLCILCHLFFSMENLFFYLKEAFMGTISFPQPHWNLTITTIGSLHITWIFEMEFVIAKKILKIDFNN